jgi:hypothetical protein
MVKSSYTKNINKTLNQVTDYYLYGNNGQGDSVKMVENLGLSWKEEDGQKIYTGGDSLPLGGNEIDIQTFFTDYASDLRLEYKLTLPDGGMEITRDKVGESMKFQADMLIEIPLWFTAGEGVAISFDDMVSDDGKDLLNREPDGTSGLDMIKYVGINFQLNSKLGDGLDAATFKIYAKGNTDGINLAFEPKEIRLSTDSQNIGIDINNLPNPFIPVFRLEIPNGQEFSFSKDSTISMKSIGLTADIEQSYDL